jgi:hypothetical protein
MYVISGGPIISTRPFLRRTLVIAMTVGILVSPPSVASQFSGPFPESLKYVACSVLYDYCKAAARGYNVPDLTPTDVLDTGACLGYLDGITSTLSRYSSELSFCIPLGPRGSVIYQQVLPIFLAWVGHHPEALQEPEDQCVLTALHETYPCHLE